MRVLSLDRGRGTGARAGQWSRRPGSERALRGAEGTESRVSVESPDGARARLRKPPDLVRRCASLAADSSEDAVLTVSSWSVLARLGLM